MLPVRKKHNHRAEWPTLIVPNSRTQVLTETVWTDRPKDNLVVTRKNIVVFRTRTNDVPAFKQMSALVQQSMRLLSL